MTFPFCLATIASMFAVDLLLMQQAGNRELSFWLLPRNGLVKALK
jgi:hypothetical protein